MTEPYVHVIAVAVFTVAWLMVMYSDGHRPTSFPHALAIAIVLGWVCALLAEGFGLFGPYAGPEPHM